MVLKAELAATVRRATRESRRQISARQHRRHLKDLPDGYQWIRWNRVPVAAKIDPGLRLPEHRKAFVRTVVEALGARGIAHWWVPPAEGDQAQLGVGEEDRSAVLDVLASVAGPSWYADLITVLGRSGRLIALADLKHSAGGAAAVRIWEFVAARPDNTFMAADESALDIAFWSPAPDRADVRRTEAPSAVASELPTQDCRGFGEVPAALRVRQLTAVDFPIDVVYTWVDGADEAWLQTLAEATGVADPAQFTEKAHDEARFADHDELRYSLRALEQFAPWVNHVWVVTADQTPAWLQPDHPWISVVSHRDIFPDQIGLPTFNSHAIEASLHRVPGIAEHFLYLNDDMIFGRPLTPERFFHPSGIGKFFNSRALVGYGEAIPGEIASTTAAKRARALLAETHQATFARKFYHTAVAMRRSVAERLEHEYPEVVAATRQAQFRTVNDVALAGSFYLNYAYLTGASVPSRLRYDYIDPAAPDAAWREKRLLQTRRFDAFCINDGTTQETEDERRQTDQAIRSFLEDYLPVPGSFER